ncbi:MAG: helix-turn-helix transcriptional regulator [Chitinophagaceae bacterium]
MPVIYTPVAMLCLMAAVLCLLTGIILLVFSAPSHNKANVYLGASYIAMGLTFTVVFLVITRLVLYVPHFYRTGNIFWLLYIPLCYLYVSMSIRPRALRWRDTIHLIPVLVYMIDFAPFLFSSTTKKLAIIRDDLADFAGVATFNEGWLLPDDTIIPVRTSLMAFYWIIQIYLITSLSKNFMLQNRRWMWWQIGYNCLLTLLFLPTLVTFITGQSYGWIASILPSIALSISVIMLLLNPTILYGLKEEIIKPMQQPVAVKQKFVFEGVIGEEIAGKLEKLMKEQKPYLNSNYTLQELAQDLKMSPHQLSAFMNQVPGRNFKDYLNKQRIQHCLDLIRHSDISKLNLNGLARQCGFNNRNTFSIAFKKVTGKAPSEYLTGK